MPRSMTRWTALALVLWGSSAAQATTDTTHLSFSSLLGFSTQMSVDHTVGGHLAITPVGGKLLVNVLGELGVTNRVIGDYSINKNEGILFTFDQKVSLSNWDLDDLPGGRNQFSLRVDGGSALTLSMGSVAPSAPMVGQTFQFGWSGEAYLMDSVTFTAWHEPVSPPHGGSSGGFVTPVPEPSVYAMMAASLITIGAMTWRRAKK